MKEKKRKWLNNRLLCPLFGRYYGLAFSYDVCTSCGCTQFYTSAISPIIGSLFSYANCLVLNLTCTCGHVLLHK